MSGGMPGCQVSGDVLGSLGTPGCTGVWRESHFPFLLLPQPLSFSAASTFRCFHNRLLPHFAASRIGCFHAWLLPHFYFSTASTFLLLYSFHISWLGSIESTGFEFPTSDRNGTGLHPNIKTSHSYCCSRGVPKIPFSFLKIFEENSSFSLSLLTELHSV